MNKNGVSHKSFALICYDQSIRESLVTAIRREMLSLRYITESYHNLFPGQYSFSESLVYIPNICIIWSANQTPVQYKFV